MKEPIPMSEDEFSQQEQEEFEQWLSQYDRETIKNLDEHMQKMWESFQESFGKVFDNQS